MERGPEMLRISSMTTLTFRGVRYEPRSLPVDKPCLTLTYRRATYRVRQLEASLSEDLCVPDGFIRSKRTAKLIGIPLEPCSAKHLVYRGIPYSKG